MFYNSILMEYDEATAPDALKGSYFVFEFSADHVSNGSNGLVLCHVDNKGYLRVSLHPYE